MSCTNFQRTISLHKNVKYQSVILTIIEGDFQLVFENIELDTLSNIYSFTCYKKEFFYLLNFSICWRMSS